MDAELFKRELKEELRSLTPCYVKGDSITIRCPFCGDSTKSIRSAHFGVKLNMDDLSQPIVFHCFKCDVGGILTPSVLRSLSIHDLSLNSSLLAYNKNAVGPINDLGMKDNEIKNEIPIAEPTERNLFKKKYFDNRLSVSTSFEELSKLKIVFELSKYLEINDIEKVTCNRNKAIMLDSNYLGFATARNEFINFRKVYECNGQRYEKYTVFNELDNTRKFYTIPTSVDLLSNDTITINLAEGVFDILGVYFNVFKRESNNMVYTAICGSGYTNVVKYFIKMGVFNNVNLNIFSDRDRPPEFYSRMYSELKIWLNKVTLYYNDRSKDFGVPISQIKVLKKRL